MPETKKNEIPEFPKNSLGLKRGTVLKSTSELTRQIGVKIGDEIVIGYDGRYVCCCGCSWSIERIQDEILDGVGKLLGKSTYRTKKEAKNSPGKSNAYQSKNMDLALFCRPVVLGGFFIPNKKPILLIQMGCRNLLVFFRLNLFPDTPRNNHGRPCF